MHRDPPHYLKPLATTSTPKRLAFLACRGYTRKVRGRYEKHFQAAALGTTHYTARKGERKDTLKTYAQPFDLWEDVERYCVACKRVVLWSYDLAEQIRLAKMLTFLPDRGWNLEKIVLERTAAWCLLRKEKRSLMCCDLKSWVPVGWGKIRSDIWTGEEALVDMVAGRDWSNSSCVDAAITIRFAVLQILNWIEGENLGPFRPTGSGQSYAAYRRRFTSRRLLVHDSESRLDGERRAMHTGRAEAWRHGSLRNGSYAEYDLHAAYATIGRDCAVPTIARGAARRPSRGKLEASIEKVAVLADVTVTTEVECVPATVNKHTVWPVGTFRTWLWDPELRLALAHAEKVECHHAWFYHRERALQGFCTYVLNNMEGEASVYGKLPQRVLKHWSRSLVGRFGLRYRAWHKFGDQDPPDVRLITYLDLDDGNRTDMLLAGSHRLLLGDLEESPESLPQIPGWIMSECRRRLWEWMTYAGLENLVYCDTDSIIVRGGLGDRDRHDHAADLVGLFAHKGTYGSMIIHGPRNLSMGNYRRISGVPLTAQQSAPLEFSGEIMRSVKASMRDGELDMVVSLPRTFHLVPQDLRRQHNPDGSTSPYRLEM